MSARPRSNEVPTKLDSGRIPRRRTEKVSENIAREIVHHMQGMEPGTKLPAEAIMLEWFGVGRASLREALRLLEVHGLIVIRPGPGGGPLVAPVSSKNYAQMSSLYFHHDGATYRDLVEARLVMEPVMARLAAERQDPGDLAELRQVMELDVDVDDPSSEGWLFHATGFHELLSGMSGNPVLDLMGRSLKDLYVDRVEGQVFPHDERQTIHHEHAGIAEAILQADPYNAERLMREHMEKYVLSASERYPGIFSEIIDWR